MSYHKIFALKTTHCMKPYFFYFYQADGKTADLPSFVVAKKMKIFSWGCFSPCSIFRFFSVMLSDRVRRLSNKLHKDCGFARIVSWGSRVHFMLRGFSGNKQVSGVHVCIVFLQLGCNFDPVIPLWGWKNYSQLRNVTSVVLGPMTVCVCVSVVILMSYLGLRTIWNGKHADFNLYSSRYVMYKYHCLSASFLKCNLMSEMSGHCWEISPHSN